MKILIATDGSVNGEISEMDLLRAGMPEHFDAIVLSVADVHLPRDQATMTEGERGRVETAIEEAKEIAQESAERLKNLFPNSNFTPEAIADSPAWGIIKRAEEWDADLIVVGPKGLSGLGRMIFGSVSQKIVNHSHCSVRITRPTEKKLKDKIKLVLGMDGSTGAIHAADMVASRQWPSGTEIMIIAVLSPRLSTGTIPFANVANSIQDSYRDEEEWIRKIIKQESEKLKNAGLNVTERILFGDPKRLLIEDAEDGSIDCIFVGARGLTRIERFFTGSVSHAVASRAYCSVEIVRE
jgi:nucleotide-binding universal stress UspA family protein